MWEGQVVLENFEQGFSKEHLSPPLPSPHGQLVSLRNDSLNPSLCRALAASLHSYSRFSPVFGIIRSTQIWLNYCYDQIITNITPRLVGLWAGRSNPQGTQWALCVWLFKTSCTIPVLDIDFSHHLVQIPSLYKQENLKPKERKHCV